MNGLLNPFILGSGEIPFVPPGDLTFWHKADAITGLSDGEDILTWEDSGPNNFDVTASGSVRYRTNQVNGRPVAQFINSEGGFLFNGAFVSDIFNRTIFLVFREAPHLNSGGVFMLCPASGNAYNEDGGLMVATGGGANGLQILGGNGSSYSLEFTGAAGFQIWSEIVIAGVGRLFLNGVEVASTSYGGFTSSSQFAYGVQFLSGAFDSAFTPDMMLPEAAYYSQGIPDADHTTWVNYLKSKYAIA